MDMAPGSIIAGRYRIDQRVGAGGMGEVWLGEHLAIGMRVAIKTLLEAAAYDHEVVARFRREANLLGRIRSEHVARVVDFIEDEQAGLVLVMEYIEGSPLSKILHQRRLSVEEAIDVGCDVIDALCVLHRAHVIHRDMKPGNIIMEPQANGRLRAIVVDFGMGRIAAGAGEDLEQTNLTRADMALGTLEYMAPEQILNSRDVTAASDLYAVGAMLYRAVAGRHMFGDAQDAELARAKLMTDAPALNSGRTDRIAQGFATVVGRAVQRRPQQRYQKADEMLTDLRALQDAVRAAAFEASGAKHLLGPVSLQQPHQHAPQSQQQPQQQPQQQQPPQSQQQPHYQQQPQQQRASFPSHATPLPNQQPYAYAQQQPQQAAAQQERHSLPSGPASGQSASGAAPISVPVNTQRRGMSTGAIAALVAVVVLVIAGVMVFMLRDQLGLTHSATTATNPPAATTTAAPAPPPPPPAPPPSAAPPASAAASAEAEPLEIEQAPAPVPGPMPTAKVAPTNKPLGTAPTGATAAPSNKAPPVKAIQF